MSSKVAGRASMKKRSHPSRRNDPLRGAELAFLEGPSGVMEHRRGHFDHFLFLRNPCARVSRNGPAPLHCTLYASPAGGCDLLDWSDASPRRGGGLASDGTVIGDGHPCMGRTQFHHFGDAHPPHRGARGWDRNSSLRAMKIR